MMAWEDINDIIEDLQEAIDEIETKHPSLHSFKATIARAIASLRAERACIETKIFNRDGPGCDGPNANSDATAPPIKRRLEYMSSIANERLKDEIKSIL